MPNKERRELATGVSNMDAIRNHAKIMGWNT